MKKIIALLLAMVLVGSVCAALAGSFKGTTISETSWNTFDEGTRGIATTWGCKVDVSTKPTVGIVFRNDKFTWASSKYTYPVGGNTYPLTWHAYNSGIPGDEVLYWRMRTNDVTTGKADVEGYFFW